MYLLKEGVKEDMVEATKVDIEGGYRVGSNGGHIDPIRCYDCDKIHVDIYWPIHGLRSIFSPLTMASLIWGMFGL
jgi:hypothetical protein